MGERYFWSHICLLAAPNPKRYIPRSNSHMMIFNFRPHSPRATLDCSLSKLQSLTHPNQGPNLPYLSLSLNVTHSIERTRATDGSFDLGQSASELLKCQRQNLLARTTNFLHFTSVEPECPCNLCVCHSGLFPSRGCEVAEAVDAGSRGIWGGWLASEKYWRKCRTANQTDGQG